MTLQVYSYEPITECSGSTLITVLGREGGSHAFRLGQTTVTPKVVDL